jgi:hypothetical protein
LKPKGLKAKAGGWSFELTERVKRRADGEIAKDESLLARQRSAADDAAEVLVTNKGDAFISINLIPAETRSKMSPTTLAKFEKLAEENRKPKEIKPDSSDAMALRAMMDSDDPAFLNVKLSDYIGKVTRDEMSGFVSGQAKARTKPAGDAWSPYGGINTALTTMKRINPDVKLDKDDEARVTIDIAAEARALKAAGKPVDYDELAKKYTRRVVVNQSTLFGVTPAGVPLYDVGMNNIPEAKRTEITNFLKSRLGRDPKDDEVVAAFHQTYRFQTYNK